MTDDCIFCKIIAENIPCNKLYEDKNTLAFLDINPATDKGGHTLIMPKKHYELIIDIPEIELQNLIHWKMFITASDIIVVEML